MRPGIGRRGLTQTRTPSQTDSESDSHGQTRLAVLTHWQVASIRSRQVLSVARAAADYLPFRVIRTARPGFLRDNLKSSAAAADSHGVLPAAHAAGPGAHRGTGRMARRVSASALRPLECKRHSGRGGWPVRRRSDGASRRPPAPSQR